MYVYKKITGMSLSMLMFHCESAANGGRLRYAIP